MEMVSNVIAVAIDGGAIRSGDDLAQAIAIVVVGLKVGGGRS